MKRLTLLIVALFVSVSAFASEPVIKFSVTKLPDPRKIEDHVYQIMNKERKDRGLKPLKRYAKLDNIARIHSANMIKHKFYAHNDHKGWEPWDRLSYYHPEVIGNVSENIYNPNIISDEKKAAEYLMKGWMNSTGHRENILDRSSSHFGVGIVLSDSGSMYATQNFGNIISKYCQNVKKTVKYKSVQLLRFKFMGNFPKDKITIFIHFPDSSATYSMPDGSYYTGAALLTPVWDGEYFLIKFKFNKGLGKYKVSMGSYGTYYGNGITLEVK